MAGIAGTVGAGAAAVGASQLLGASAAIGGGYATTSGDRNVTANTVQTLSDSVRQHSTALRDMRSTVVVQSQQAEHSSAQTRTVVNHNHAHAMTVLYYEVLRHYRVVIDRGTVRPAILLRQPMPPFTEDAVGTYRRFIEPGLLEPDLASGFDAIEKFNAWTELNPPVPPDPGAVNFDLFTLTIHVAGHYNRDGVNYRVSAILDSGTVELSKPGGGSTDLGGGGIRAGETDTFVGVPPTPVTWRSLRGLKVHVDVLASGNDPYGLGFDHISVHVRTTDGGDMVLCEQAIDWDTGSTKDGKYTTDFDAPIAWPGPKPVALTPVQRLSDGENLARVQLIHHLNANLPFYYRLIWLGEAPSDRYYRLSSYKLEVDGVARPLFGAVENRALDVLGDMTAFALDPELLPPEGTTGRHLYMPVIADAHSEQLVSLPTRGVFAEAKLGHCNAAEVIDNTRFWDWQSSPDPDQPPAISGVDLGSRDQQANTTPTPLPGSTLNIVNPPAAPDPVGMAGALALLGRSGLFTDMSMQNQVPALLGTLAADATAAGRSASSTAAASLPRGGGAGAGTGGGVVGSAIGGTRARPSDPSAINRDLQDLQGVLRQAQQSGLLTPEGAQAAYGAALSDALTPDLQQVGDIYVPPATTLNQLVGLIGEQILNAALKQKGFIVFADWRKHVSGNGIDVAALSPDGEVWYIDNKAWKRGISGADALTGDQFVVNQAEVEAFLQNVYSNKAEADAALAAIRAGKVRKVVSNGFAGEVTTFTKKCFDKGLSVFDLRFLRMFASHPEWFSAYSGLKVAGGLRKGMRLTGQRGCMTVEGTLVVFAVGAASGAAYLVTSGSDVNLSQIKGLAAQLVFDTVVGLLPGGFVAAFLTGLKSDADPRGQAALGLNDEVNALVDMLPGHENLTFEDLTSVRATIYDLMDSRFEFIEPAPRGGPAPAPGVFPPSPPPPGRWPPSPPPPGATT